MKCVYAALFEKNNDGSYTVTFPDLPGCISEGKSLIDAAYMAQSALKQWVEYLTDKNEILPSASDISSIQSKDNAFTSLVCVDVRDNKAVKRTVSLPQWMDAEASAAGLSLSKVLQDALGERLQ